jgi:hypothetical protein
MPRLNDKLGTRRRTKYYKREAFVRSSGEHGYTGVKQRKHHPTRCSQHHQNGVLFAMWRYSPLHLTCMDVKDASHVTNK